MVDNLAHAFETLYARAQRADNPREHGTAVFEIGPTASYDILSFHPDDLARSVRDGRAAARSAEVFGDTGFMEVSGALPQVEVVKSATDCSLKSAPRSKTRRLRSSSTTTSSSPGRSPYRPGLRSRTR